MNSEFEYLVYRNQGAVLYSHFLSSFSFSPISFLRNCETLEVEIILDSLSRDVTI